MKQMFFWRFPCFLYDPTDGELISGLLPFLNPAWTSGIFPVHILLKQSLKDFGHNPAGICSEDTCTVVCIIEGTEIKHLNSDLVEASMSFNVLISIITFFFRKKKKLGSLNLHVVFILIPGSLVP